MNWLRQSSLLAFAGECRLSRKEEPLILRVSADLNLGDLGGAAIDEAEDSTWHSMEDRFWVISDADVILCRCFLKYKQALEIHELFLLWNLLVKQFIGVLLWTDRFLLCERACLILWVLVTDFKFWWVSGATICWVIILCPHINVGLSVLKSDLLLMFSHRAIPFCKDLELHWGESLVNIEFLNVNVLKHLLYMSRPDPSVYLQFTAFELWMDFVLDLTWNVANFLDSNSRKWLTLSIIWIMGILHVFNVFLEDTSFLDLFSDLKDLIKSLLDVLLTVSNLWLCVRSSEEKLILLLLEVVKRFLVIVNDLLVNFD